MFRTPKLFSYCLFDTITFCRLKKDVLKEYVRIQLDFFEKQKVQEPRQNFRDRGESLFRATVKYRHTFALVASAFKNGSYTHIAARSIITQTKYLSHFIN